MAELMKQLAANPKPLRVLNVRITDHALQLLKQEADRRYRAEAQKPRYGKIISDLIEAQLGHLWPPIDRAAPTSVRKRLVKTA